MVGFKDKTKFSQNLAYMLTWVVLDVVLSFYCAENGVFK